MIKLYVPSEHNEYISRVTGVRPGEILTEYGSVPLTAPVVRSVVATFLIRSGLRALRTPSGARVTAVVRDLVTDEVLEVHTTAGRVPGEAVPLAAVLHS